MTAAREVKLVTVETLRKGDEVRWNSKDKKAVTILSSTRDAEGSVILETTARDRRTYQRGDRVILVEPKAEADKRWGR